MPLPLESPGFIAAFLSTCNPPHPVVGQGANTNCTKNTPDGFLSSPARTLATIKDTSEGGNRAQKCARQSSRGRKKKVGVLSHCGDKGGVGVGGHHALRITLRLIREESSSAFWSLRWRRERREIRGWGGGVKRRRSTHIGGLIRAAQSPVRPEPFVVMCHTPGRQRAS